MNKNNSTRVLYLHTFRGGLLQIFFICPPSLCSVHSKAHLRQSGREVKTNNASLCLDMKFSLPFLSSLPKFPNFICLRKHGAVFFGCLLSLQDVAPTAIFAQSRNSKFFGVFLSPCKNSFKGRISRMKDLRKAA